MTYIFLPKTDQPSNPQNHRGYNVNVAISDNPDRDCYQGRSRALLPRNLQVPFLISKMTSFDAAFLTGHSAQ